MSQAEGYAMTPPQGTSENTNFGKSGRFPEAATTAEWRNSPASHSMSVIKPSQALGRTLRNHPEMKRESRPTNGSGAGANTISRAAI